MRQEPCVLTRFFFHLSSLRVGKLLETLSVVKEKRSVPSTQSTEVVFKNEISLSSNCSLPEEYIPKHLRWTISRGLSQTLGTLQDFLWLLPHLIPFLNPGFNHPGFSPTGSTSPWLFLSSQSQHPLALCGIDASFSAVIVLPCRLWIFLSLPSLHPFLKTHS